ncbi:hypothetical protein, partial [Vineibacter terrae]|uniref:hypothetical protein n=1 Tax=Vineibacter terrae TaxID=2586908 RepID=UPI002E346A8F
MPAWITETRRDVIARLRAAIAAADPDTPLDGLKLPANRWKRYTPQDMPGMFVRVARVRRQGIGTNVPHFDFAADIEVHAAVAALELDAAQLDDRLEAIFDAVDLVLLEDPVWVARFTSVTAADIEYDDAEGSDHYIRVGMVTYTVTVEQ